LRTPPRRRLLLGFGQLLLLPARLDLRSATSAGEALRPPARRRRLRSAAASGGASLVTRGRWRGRRGWRTMSLPALTWRRLSE